MLFHRTLPHGSTELGGSLVDMYAALPAHAPRTIEGILRARKQLGMTGIAGAYLNEALTMPQGDGINDIPSIDVGEQDPERNLTETIEKFSQTALDLEAALKEAAGKLVIVYSAFHPENEYPFLDVQPKINAATAPKSLKGILLPVDEVDYNPHRMLGIKVVNRVGWPGQKVHISVLPALSQRRDIILAIK